MDEIKPFSADITAGDESVHKDSIFPVKPEEVSKELKETVDEENLEVGGSNNVN